MTCYRIICNKHAGLIILIISIQPQKRPTGELR